MPEPGADLVWTPPQVHHAIHQMAPEFEHHATSVLCQRRARLHREISVDGASQHINVAQPPLASRFDGSGDALVESVEISDLQQELAATRFLHQIPECLHPIAGRLLQVQMLAGCNRLPPITDGFSHHARLDENNLDRRIAE